MGTRKRSGGKGPHTIRNHPLGITKHHRKPTTIGGEDKPYNKSYVHRYKHEAWHMLFLNLPAEEVVRKFEYYYSHFGLIKSGRTAEQKEHVRNLEQRSPSLFRKLLAWKALFDGKVLEEVIREINTVWLDPDYAIDLNLVLTHKKRKRSVTVARFLLSRRTRKAAR